MKRIEKFCRGGNCKTSSLGGNLPAGGYGAGILTAFFSNLRARRPRSPWFYNYLRISVITAAACIWMHVFCGPVQAMEAGSFRLLSISEMEKMVLVSRIPDQKKFLLDAEEVKVTINDKPAEFKDLVSFTIVQVQMKLKKKKTKGISIDGNAIEIAVSETIKE